MSSLSLDKSFGYSMVHVGCMPHSSSSTFTAGAIGGIVLALLMIILVSLPLCCGILKQYGKARKPRGWKSSVSFCSFCPDVDFGLPSFIGASAPLRTVHVMELYGTFFA